MESYKACELQDFCQRVFIKLGMKDQNAVVAAEAIVRANLEGVDSHGISRLPIYARRMKEGRINAKAEVEFDRRSEGVLVVDGKNALGHVASVQAVRAGIEAARTAGISAVAVHSSNHFGTASYYCQMACDQGMAAIAFTNSPSGIPPWGGTQAFFGTNPIAFGFPVEEPLAPVIIDMSTSVVARGKIILAAKQNQTIPKGWAIDENGLETEDAKEALKGAILPFGGAKGYALALAVEILTGVLSGAAYGPHVQNIYDEHGNKANVGHFFLIINIEKFMPAASFSAIMEDFLREIKSVPYAADTSEILYPGERRKREYEYRMKEGISLPLEVVSELEELGKEVGVRFRDVSFGYSE